MPNKNIRMLLGKPLLVHSIEHAQQSGLFERIAVSSDSAEILAVARAAGVNDIIERPLEMASDTAAKVPAILHALTVVESGSGTEFDTLVDIDATSPLRLVEDVVNAVHLLEHAGSSSVITGAPSHRSPYFNMVEQSPDGSVRLSKELAVGIVLRQDAPPTFDMNASIYVWRTDEFRRNPRVFYSDTRLYEMPRERSIDIDAPHDFEVVEFILRRRSMKKEVSDGCES